MIVKTESVDEKKVSADALVMPFFEGQTADMYSDIDAACGNVISRLIASKDFSGKHGQTIILHICGLDISRLALIGLGVREEFTNERARRAGSKIFDELKAANLSDVAISTRLLKGSDSQLIFSFIEGAMLTIYRYERYKSKKTIDEAEKNIKSLIVLCETGAFDLKWLEETVSAVYFARDMVNAPANDMTPTTIAEIALSLEEYGLKVTVLDRAEIEEEGMGAYLSVAKGSDQPPKFIIVERMNGDSPPVVLIGKTITFDSGGLDIKPGEGMERMKDDMAGGAAVLAVMKAAAALKLPINVVGILPAAENLLGGGASRPGDVVKTITGRTVEIINTDAEGRLTLADAIGYAIKYKSPSAIIDIATLTGACNIAFGNEAIAMMGNDERLMGILRAASEEVYERVWPMPLFDEFGEYLKSDIADVKNVGGRKASLCSSAYFLKDFAGSVPWIHLDIAGAAWNETDRPYSPKGASGVGVRLLLAFLKRLTSSLNA